MKKQNSGRSSVEKIESLVKSIKHDDINLLEGAYLDESLTEFFLLNDEIIIPSIPAAELDYETGYDITGNLARVIPEYLQGHQLLEKRKPSAEQHSLHFFKLLEGKTIDFVHILRFDFKLSGNYGRITGKGDSRMFPPYATEKIRYKSRLIPVTKGSNPQEIESLRLKSSLDVDTDGRKFTAVFFDEFSTTEISIDFSIKAGSDIYSIPSKIYPFISYDYFTACLNIPDPYEKKLDTAIELFEPLFMYLYFQYRETDHEIDIKAMGEWNDFLENSESGIIQTPVFTDKLRGFFSKYTLYRNDDLLLKGLRKFSISE